MKTISRDQSVTLSRLRDRGLCDDNTNYGQGYRHPYTPGDMRMYWTHRWLRQQGFIGVGKQGGGSGDQAWPWWMRQVLATVRDEPEPVVIKITADTVEATTKQAIIGEQVPKMRKALILYVPEEVWAHDVL